LGLGLGPERLAFWGSDVPSALVLPGRRGSGGAPAGPAGLGHPGNGWRGAGHDFEPRDSGM